MCGTTGGAKTIVLSCKTLKLQREEPKQVLEVLLSQAEITGQVQFNEGDVWWVSASGKLLS